MVKTTVRIPAEFDIEWIYVSAGVRYWEDATVDGSVDEDGVLIPCRQKDYWKPIINANSGQIVNWKKGITAKIHYKVCDDGEYRFNSKCGTSIITEGYVTSFFSIDSNGYGDYITMSVDDQGFIQNWDCQNVASYLETYESY